jgi:hypothetical protein
MQRIAVALPAAGPWTARAASIGSGAVRPARTSRTKSILTCAAVAERLVRSRPKIAFVHCGPGEADLRRPFRLATGAVAKLGNDKDLAVQDGFSTFGYGPRQRSDIRGLRGPLDHRSTCAWRPATSFRLTRQRLRPILREPQRPTVGSGSACPIAACAALPQSPFRLHAKTTIGRSRQPSRRTS